MPIAIGNTTTTPLSGVLAERRYISRYSIDTLGLQVRRAGEMAAADGAVRVSMQSFDASPGRIFTRQASRAEDGSYEVTLSSVETQYPGLYAVEWNYALDGVAQTYTGYVEIGEVSPAYDALDVGFKGIIESAYIRFADLYDSPTGGPHLAVYFQTRFGRERMAQLLKIALGRLNTVAQPRMTYSTDPEGKQFPYAQWGGLLDQALYIECIKHLIRSYVEQPEVIGVVVARMDRRDYMNRWQAVLDQESRDFERQLEHFKIAHMGLGRSRVLVSGGVYGSYGPTRFPGLAARPAYWTRFYG